MCHPPVRPVSKYLLAPFPGCISGCIQMGFVQQVCSLNDVNFKYFKSPQMFMSKYHGYRSKIHPSKIAQLNNQSLLRLLCSKSIGEKKENAEHTCLELCGTTPAGCQWRLMRLSSRSVSNSKASSFGCECFAGTIALSDKVDHSRLKFALSIHKNYFPLPCKI